MAGLVPAIHVLQHILSHRPVDILYVGTTNDLVRRAYRKKTWMAGSADKCT
jgi:hypothetical protein